MDNGTTHEISASTDCPCEGCTQARQEAFEADTYEDWFDSSCEG